MKKYIFFIIFFLATNLIIAQGRGKEGQSTPNASDKTEIINNSETFEKSSSANYKISLQDVNAFILCDTSKWIITERASSISFKHKDPYFLEVNFYVNYWKKTDSEHYQANLNIWEGIYKNLKVNEYETREVNGTSIIYYEYEGDFGSSPQLTYGYLKTLEAKTITFRVVVAKSKHEYFKEDIMELLNGLVFQ